MTPSYREILMNIQRGHTGRLSFLLAVLVVSILPILFTESNERTTSSSGSVVLVTPVVQ